MIEDFVIQKTVDKAISRLSKSSFVKKLAITILVLTGSAAVILNGDGLTPIFRQWHPLTWVLWVSLVPFCIFNQNSIMDEMLPSDYWKLNKSRMIYVPVKDLMHIWK